MLRQGWFTRRRSLLIASLTIIVFTLLVLLRLGHYPLWDDETDTAIFGHGVWQTGDTTARFGHNILAYKDGFLLDDKYRERCTSPLSYFVVAPFIGLFGTDPFFVRLPFALAGIFTVVFGFYWLHRTKATFQRNILVSLGVLGNIAFILYCRQARYYSLTPLFSMLAVYFYLRPGSDPKRWIGLTVSLGLLLSSHYLAYAAVIVALCADYLLSERRDNPLRRRHIALTVATQMLIGWLVFFTWYPLDKENLERASLADWIYRKLQIVWFNLRDINSGELGVGILAILLPLGLIIRKKGNSEIMRLALGLCVVVFTLSLLSPAQGINVATLRYLSFLIPGLIYLTVLALESMNAGPTLTFLIATFAFFTTALNIPFASVAGGPMPPLRSTFLSYINELRLPPQITYATVSNWLNENVDKRKTAVVWPRYATYPLMYHSPHLTYGWQFSEKAAERFPDLPPVQVRSDVFSRVPTKPPYELSAIPSSLTSNSTFPDYIVVFGHPVSGVRRWLDELRKAGIDYREIARFPVNASHKSRPEIFDHTFAEIPIYNPDTQGAYVYRKLNETTDGVPQ